MGLAGPEGSETVSVEDPGKITSVLMAYPEVAKILLQQRHPSSAEFDATVAEVTRIKFTPGTRVRGFPGVPLGKVAVFDAKGIKGRISFSLGGSDNFPEAVFITNVRDRYGKWSGSGYYKAIRSPLAHSDPLIVEWNDLSIKFSSDLIGT